MARKAVSQELSREIILEEAKNQFVQRGYHAVTMRSIAKVLGYSHGALYYHFKEKAELFGSIVNEDFNELLKKEYEILKGIPKGKMTMEHFQHMMLEFLCFCVQRAHSYEIMFVMRDPELRKYSTAKQKQFMEFFALAMKRLFPGIDSEKRLLSLTKSILMSLHGFISYHIHYKQPYEEVCPFAKEHVDIACRGIFLKEFESDLNKLDRWRQIRAN